MTLSHLHIGLRNMVIAPFLKVMMFVTLRKRSLSERIKFICNQKSLSLCLLSIHSVSLNRIELSSNTFRSRLRTPPSLHTCMSVINKRSIKVMHGNNCVGKCVCGIGLGCIIRISMNTHFILCWMMAFRSQQVLRPSSEWDTLPCCVDSVMCFPL